MTTVSILNDISSLFRDGKGNFEFSLATYYLDNGQRNYKPQTKHADRMIRPSSSQKYECTFEFTGAEKETAQKVRFCHWILSHAKLLTSTAVIELLHAQNDNAFIIVAHLSPLVCKLVRVVVWLTAVQDLQASHFHMGS